MEDDYPSDKHLKRSQENAVIAAENFKSKSIKKTWIDPETKKEFQVRAAKAEDYCDLPELGWSWPRAWVSGESQPVAVAVWWKDLLVEILTFSPSRDKTNSYFLFGFEDPPVIEELDEFKDSFEDEEMKIPEDFFNAGGDSEDVKKFYCPALENPNKW